MTNVKLQLVSYAEARIKKGKEFFIEKYLVSSKNLKEVMNITSTLKKVDVPLRKSCSTMMCRSPPGEA